MNYRVVAAAVTVLVVAFLLGVGAQTAYAASITVDGTTCTLADAITAANTDTATGGCVAGSGADTIDLQTDVTLTSPLPNIASELTIEGNGHTIARDTTAPNIRILSVGSSANLTLNRATLANGIADGYSGSHTSSGRGGAIENFGTTTINNSIIRDNQARIAGGGIANNKGANLTVNNSSFTGNSYLIGSGYDYTYGAGIVNTGGTATINNSTFSNNSGGAALDNWRERDNTGAKNVMTVNNSTIVVGPAGARPARGIIVQGEGDVTIDSLTIIGTSPPDRFGRPGPPIHIAVLSNSFTPGTVALTIGNSIVFDPSGGTVALCSKSVADGGVASIISSGHNLASDASCGFTATGDQQNVSAADLKLGPLADNGGPTQTYALLPGSVAIDAGDTTLTTDQRGVTRPQGSADDIGAFEAQACTAGPWSVGNEAELNAAIFCYNNETAPDTYVINVTQNISLTASANVINNATNGVSLDINGGDSDHKLAILASLAFG